jgi:hypothetical protein
MSDHELIDPTRDRVWAVDVADTYTVYVIAETAGEAERIAEKAEPAYHAHELTKPLVPSDVDAETSPYGRSRWENRKLTVNEALDLIAGHKPVYDTQTALMPFATTPPPLRPARIEDYLADAERAR